MVFLALRDDGAFRKNVALKLLLHEQVSPEFIQRFKQERQVLAAMDHANIARILDGGDAPNGMPFSRRVRCVAMAPGGASQCGDRRARGQNARRFRRI